MRGLCDRSSHGWSRAAAPAVFITPLALGLAFGGLAAQGPTANGANGAEADVTFSKDVAPILQANCQICHRPGSVGPMPLLDYRDTRRWASRMKELVSQRLMPPYHLDTGVGIQDIKGDWRLSDEEIETVVAWADAGAPEGDPADMPTPIEWPNEQKWQLEDVLGPPDHVIKSKPFDVPAEGGDTWWRPRVPTGLEEDRWITAFETRPSFPAGRQVVHHAIPRLLRLDEEGEYQRIQSLSEYAMGKIGEIVPTDAGRLLKANDMIEWDAHYYPMGYEVDDDQVELGIWFHREGFEPEFTQDLSLYPLRGDIALAPGGTAMTQGFHRWDHPVRLDSFQPHGHVHLHAMSIQAIYPDGKVELVSMVTDFDARWHHSYIYEDDAAPLLPTGTVLVMTGWYDNTEENDLTPDPEIWYARGSRTGDEMSHAWLAVTHLSEDGFERLVEERETLTSDDDADDSNNDGNSDN
ncbi:c-type cytochrome [Candidatus Palauibacter sp.]|uniref:c-type cytochrome n=1 Tax=Candidatus Palauibacter sp. TaxID=3101350 RepID=UPI003B5B1859